ncbi:MAG: electron transfer flavoprotein subunit alpha/FixB family protein [Flavobacteriaceae bacterium]
MSVLIYAESENGQLKKIALELASFGKAIADQLNTNLVAVTINCENNDLLGNYGVNEVLAVSQQGDFNAQQYAATLSEAAKSIGAHTIAVSSSADSRFLAPLVAVTLDAGYVTNVVGAPISSNPFQVKRSVFTNKAFSVCEIATEVKMVGLSKNAFGVHENQTTATITNFSPASAASDMKVTALDKATDTVTIADAEIVVSGGRGLKGPENWHLIEDLADALGAATACSKPVSDMGWRPHSEHVGQTGKPVASNLYIAIGVSGAIQHLAGINSSKVKVVINNDPEAPFFKAADYGVVGDAFEVVPKIIEKLKSFQAENA